MKQRGIHEPGPTAASGEGRAVKGRPRGGRRLFVLDTNVLMHDPTAIFRFEEHDVYLPMVVLEELDAHKKGLSEASRNVRQVSRFLDDMMRDVTKEQIDRGLQLPSGYSGNHGKQPLERAAVLPDTPALERAARQPARAERATTRSSRRRSRCRTSSTTRA